MATEIITKFSNTPAAEPVPGDLVEGELAVNTNDLKIFTKDNGGTVVELSAPVTKAVIDALNIDADTLDGIDSTGFLLVGGVAADSTLFNGNTITTFARTDTAANITANWEFQDNKELRFGNGNDVAFDCDGTRMNINMYDAGGEYISYWDNGSGQQRFQFRQQGGFTAGTDVPTGDIHRGDICAYGSSSGWSGSYADFELTAESSGYATLAFVGGSGGEIVFADTASTYAVAIKYEYAQGYMWFDTPGPGELYFDNVYGTIHSSQTAPNSFSSPHGVETDAFNCADDLNEPQLNVAYAGGDGTVGPWMSFSTCPDNWGSPSTVASGDYTGKITGSVYDGVVSGGGAMIELAWSLRGEATQAVTTSAAGQKIVLAAMRDATIVSEDMAEFAPDVTTLSSDTVHIATNLTEEYHINSGAATSIDMTNGAYQKMVPSTSKTFTFDNAPASGVASTLFVELAPTGTVTITWPTSVDWRDGTAPSTPASGATSIYAFITHDGGTTWFGSDYGQNFA